MAHPLSVSLQRKKQTDRFDVTALGDQIRTAIGEAGINSSALLKEITAGPSAFSPGTARISA